MLFYVIANFVFLALTAPWIFLAMGEDAVVFGLPLWAVYTIVASAAYAVFIAVSISRMWRTDEEGSR